MSENGRFDRFIKSLMVSVLGGALLVTLFVVLVDPYRIHRLVEVAGFNLVKPGLDRFQSEIKIAGAKAMGADVFLMGNSRIEIGLDPDSKEFAGSKRSPFNLAVPGSGVDLARHEFASLRAAGNSPSVLVLGAEFLDFLVDPKGLDTPVKHQKRGLESLRWRVETIFSIGAFLDAVRTLQIQHNAEAVTMTSRGFNPLLEYRRFARDEGYNSIFRQRAAGNAISLAREPHGLARTRTGTSPEWAALHALLSDAAASKTEVQLVIYPYHAQILAMFEEAGLWPLFEQWKGMLVEEIARVQSQNPGAKLTVWDFSGFSDIQCEQVPAAGDYSSATMWYWEAGHFKSALGDLILARVLGSAGASSLPRDFGIPLDLNKLDQNRERIARERSTCVSNYPGLFKDVAEMMAVPVQRLSRMPESQRKSGQVGERPVAAR